MEKTLRGACESVISAHRIPAYEEPYRRETLAANVALGEALGSLQGPHRFDTVAGSKRILAALDAERAAALEEVRAFLGKRYADAIFDHESADESNDDMCIAALEEARDTYEGFTRRFLAGKEGA